MAYRGRFTVCASEASVCFLNPGARALTHSSCPGGARLLQIPTAICRCAVDCYRPRSAVLSSTPCQACASAPPVSVHGLPSGLSLWPGASPVPDEKSGP